MDEGQIREKLKIYLGSRRAGLSDDTELFETGALDSMGMLDLIAFIEETFGVAFGPNELKLENFRSVRVIAARVRAGLAGR